MHLKTGSLRAAASPRALAGPSVRWAGAASAGPSLMALGRRLVAELATLLPWVVMVLTTATTAVARPAKPNFVLFFVDDMGIDQVQVPAAQRSYGYTGNGGKIQTPHVSQLASEGVVFQSWYSGFHVCSPSRAAMLTGRLPIRSGVGSPNAVYAPNAPGPSQGLNMVFSAESVGGLPLNETTFAERLKPLGYQTMAIGKVRYRAASPPTTVSPGFS
jgi:arylsulfatase A